ncbi:hypothetical protein BC938DRAFT_481536 [Jimgerdemannia flammicorona]|uniref:Uncharacterized protein n=1 Tax=Jimgerdemannia flammicorona TaxID=994334 RepID=A0A433QG14_9FUNG|nr:hypothetical protein BC938DRAFT_481536 [Jimgerdemannia flammicorona]
MTQQPNPPQPDPSLEDTTDLDVDSILKDIDNAHHALDDLEAKADALDEKLNALLEGVLKEASPAAREAITNGAQVAVGEK